MFWYLEVLRKYSEFSGRARRKEYWMFQLVNALIFALLVAGALITKSRPLFFLLVLGYALATFVPGLAVGVRRLHDIDFTGWWLLISLVPLGGPVLLVFHLLEGSPGPNPYGPDPRAAGRQGYPSRYAPYGAQTMATAAGAGMSRPDSQWSPRICNSCGTLIPQGNRFCLKCGQAAH